MDAMTCVAFNPSHVVVSVLHRRAVHARDMKFVPVTVNAFDIPTYEGNEALGAMVATLGRGQIVTLPCDDVAYRETFDLPTATFTHFVTTSNV